MNAQQENILALSSLTIMNSHVTILHFDIVLHLLES